MNLAVPAAVLLGAAALLQIGLSLGAPWGSIAYARGGVIGSGLSQGLLTWLTWAIVAMMILNTIGNLASASRIERYVLGTATLVIAVLSGIIAYRGPEL